jgi:GWxTD domain-containing protein
MKIRPIPALLVLCTALAHAASSGRLDERHVQFLKDVDAIMTPPERELFSRLTEPAARDLFVDLFWKARDPTPGTERNEVREEHTRRLEHARRRLHDDTPRDGALTDRGRMYILLGEPEHVEHYTGYRGLHPAELWFYGAKGNTRLPPYFYLLFYRPHDTDEFKLYIPGLENPGDLIAGNLEVRQDQNKSFEKLRDIDPELAYASVSLDATKKGGRERTETSSFSQMVVSAVESIPKDTVDTSYVEHFRPDGSVDVEPSLNYVEMDWLSRAYVHEDGETHLHYALQLLPPNLGVGQIGERTYASLLVAGSLTRQDDGKAAASIEDGVEIDLSGPQLAAVQGRPFAYLGRQFLLPGSYELRLVLKNNTARQVSRAEERLAVPDPGGADVQLSRPLLVVGAEREPKRDDGLERPFQIGELRVVPKVRREVDPAESVQLYSQLLPGRRGAEDKRWKAVLEVRREGQILRTGELRLEEARPGPAGSLHVLVPVPTAALALGPYELRLAVLDADGKPLASGSESFVLTREAPPPPWQSARRRPGPGSTEVRLERSRQLLERGRAQEAFDTLGPAASRALLTQGPLSILDGQGCVQMASICRKLGKLKEAAAYLERALQGQQPKAELWAELGQIRLELGDRPGAREAWQMSLKLQPDQQDLERQLRTLQP